MSSATSLQAAELKVIAGGSMTASLNQLAAPFEQATGHKLVDPFRFHAQHHRADQFGYAVRCRRGARRCLQGRGRKGALCPGHLDIARVGYGVDVRAGAPKPDISTPDALKKALLAAPSIAFVPASAAGAYVTKVFERLGIAEEMKAKTKVQAGPPRLPPRSPRAKPSSGCSSPMC